MENRKIGIKIENFCNQQDKSPFWQAELVFNSDECFAVINSSVSKGDSAAPLIKKYISTSSINDILSTKFLLELFPGKEETSYNSFFGLFSKKREHNTSRHKDEGYYRITISVNAKSKVLIKSFLSQDDTRTYQDSALLELIDLFIIPSLSEFEKQDAISISNDRRLDYYSFKELKDAYLSIYLKKHNMLTHEKDILTSLYSRELGELEFNEYCLIVDLSKIKRKIEMMRSYINSNLKPDIDIINSEIEKQFHIFIEEINEKAKKLVEAEQLLQTGLLTKEDSKELRKLYYEIAKQLHPDVNEHYDKKHAELFVKAKNAYEASDLETLRQILLVLKLDEGDHSSILIYDSYSEKISMLIKKIEHLQNQIKELNTKFPFMHRENLSDLQWLEERKNSIEKNITNLNKEIEKLNHYYNVLLLWNPELLN